MNNLNRIGGLSALLFGVLKIVGLALSTIAFASAVNYIASEGSVAMVPSDPPISPAVRPRVRARGSQAELG